MPRFREHRQSLEASMRTVVFLETRAQLILHLRAVLAPVPVAEADILVRHYTFDKRIGWDTYLIVVRDYGPVGFTDGPI